jgi:hypothetical protein
MNGPFGIEVAAGFRALNFRKACGKIWATVVPPLLR